MQGSKFFTNFVSLYPSLRLPSEINHSNCVETVSAKDGPIDCRKTGVIVCRGMKIERAPANRVSP